MNDRDKELEREIKALLENPNGEDDLLIKLSILKKYDIDKFMDTMYSVISENPNKVIVSSGGLGNKLKAVKALREHFEKKQEFEKCQVMQKMTDMIIDQNIQDE